jgi:hypothetical protein
VAYVTGAFTGFRSSEVLVRAYDLSNGSNLFEDRSHLGRSSVGNDIAIGQSLVFAAGTATDGDSADFLVRAYDRDAIEPKGKPTSAVAPSVTVDSAW